MQCPWCPYVADGVTDWLVNHLPIRHQDGLTKFIVSSVAGIVVTPLITQWLTQNFGTRTRK